MDMSTIEYAIRYCMSRNSYAFQDGLHLAEQHWSVLSEATKRDVLAAVRTAERASLGVWPTIQASRFPASEGDDR